MSSSQEPLRRWRDAEGAHIDVRGLPPPEPLVAILALVREAEPTLRLIVHHDRDPQLLHAELAEIGWRAERIAGAPGEVRLCVTRDP